MADKFDISRFQHKALPEGQYERQIKRLINSNKEVQFIEQAVSRLMQKFGKQVLKWRTTMVGLWLARCERR